MTDVSFKSTYKIPMTQWGVNNTKKILLKSMISSYPNGIITKGKDSCALISIPDKKDTTFLRKLRKLGFLEFKQMEGENIKKDSLVDYVKNTLG